MMQVINRRVRIFATVHFLVMSAVIGNNLRGDAAAEHTTGEQALKALRNDLQNAQENWLQKYRKAATDDERNELRKADPYRTFEPKFLRLADMYAGQPEAMDALSWLVDSASPGTDFDKALLLIEKHHLEYKDIVQICRKLRFRLSPGVERLLLFVAEKHPEHKVQGIAYACLAQYLKLRYDMTVTIRVDEEDWLHRAKLNFTGDVIEWFRAADPVELSNRVDNICRIIVGRYGDVADDNEVTSDGQRRTLADAANAISFSLHAVGSIAPEFNGKSGDGSQVRLADYRGKIVILMFSADWCTPCKQVYGQLREMTKLYVDRPFSVITIMADDHVETVSKAIKSGEIIWPAIWDGSEGPIAKAWNITSYPTLYVIDVDGRIKSQGLGDDSLDDQIASMLGISPESRVKVDKRTRIWRLSFRDQKIAAEDLPKLLEGYSEIREIDLSENQLSDDALICLYPFKKLTSLNLQHTGISDEGLRNLKQLTSLRQLNLDIGPTSRTTRTGLNELQGAIPGLQISVITH